ERLIQFSALVLQHSVAVNDPYSFQDTQAAHLVPRIWVGIADIQSSYAGSYDGIRASRGAPVSRTRFHLLLSACFREFVSMFFCVAQRFNLCVRFTRAAMPALADNFARSNDDRANHRVRRRAAQSLVCEAQCQSHEDDVGGGIGGAHGDALRHAQTPSEKS